MPDKIFLHLLILCGIWSQGITGTFVDRGTKESSDIVIRQKRVLNHIPGADIPVPMDSRVSYIVKIRMNTRLNCIGSIISQKVVITAAVCVLNESAQYQVVSGSLRIDRGMIHNVIDVERNYGNHPNRPTDGIALLTVNPHFVYGSNCDRIQLHSGLLLPGTHSTISGWGYNFRNEGHDHGTCHIKYLRSIEVPIIAHQECRRIYQRHNIEISETDICTYHADKHCGHNDGGAPLVVDGSLAGVHLWSGPGRLQNDAGYPEVFAIIQSSAYNGWIRSKI